MSLEFNKFFKRHSLASTYKPMLAKCLLDIGNYEQDEGNQWVERNGDSYTVNLHFVAARFLRYYHPLRFKFKLKQEATKKRIAIYSILEEYQEQLGTKSTPSKKMMCSEKLRENFTALAHAIVRAKPPTSKGVYLRKIT